MWQSGTDFKNKLKALQDYSVLKNKTIAERPFFIISVDHEILAHQSLVIFHCKTVDMSKLQFFAKSQITKEKKWTVDIEINMFEKDIQDIIEKQCKSNQIAESDEISLVNYCGVMVEGQVCLIILVFM